MATKPLTPWQEWLGHRYRTGQIPPWKRAEHCPDENFGSFTPYDHKD